MPRFSDILKGAELNEDLTEFLKYLQKSQAEKSAAYKTATEGDARLVFSSSDYWLHDSF